MEEIFIHLLLTSVADDLDNEVPLNVVARQPHILPADQSCRDVYYKITKLEENVIDGRTLIWYPSPFPSRTFSDSILRNLTAQVGLANMSPSSCKMGQKLLDLWPNIYLLSRGSSLRLLSRYMK